MLRSVTTALLAVAFLAAAALADRFTGYMAPVGADVAQRVQALGTPSDKLGKKLAKVYAKAQKELARDTFDFAGDLKSSEKAAKALAKGLKGDAAMHELLDDAARGYVTALAVESSQLRGALLTLETSKKVTAAFRRLDAVDAFAVSSLSADDPLLIFKAARKIDKQLKSPRKVVEGAPVPQCSGRALEPDEAFDAGIDGSLFVATHVVDAVGGDGVVTLAFQVCDQRGTSVMLVSFSGTPPTDTPLDVGAPPAPTRLTYDDAGTAAGPVEGSGTLTFLEVDGPTRTYSATFDVTFAGAAAVGSFRVVIPQ